MIIVESTNQNVKYFCQQCGLSEIVDKQGRQLLTGSATVPSGILLTEG